MSDSLIKSGEYSKPFQTLQIRNQTKCICFKHFKAMHWCFTVRTKPTSVHENVWIFKIIIVVKRQLMVM